MHGQVSDSKDHTQMKTVEKMLTILAYKQNGPLFLDGVVDHLLAIDHILAEKDYAYAISSKLNFKEFIHNLVKKKLTFFNLSLIKVMCRNVGK